MGKTILLIERSEEGLQHTGDVLELASYLVLHACNGAQGVEMAIESFPDLILCDMTMPELDGFGVLHIVYGIVMWYKYERA